MKKKSIAIVAIVVCILAVVAALFGYRMVQQKQQIQDLLELGNQYLQEEQYEEAIAAYKQVLTIDSKNATATENVVVAAVEWCDDLIESGEYERAEEIIADIASIVSDDRLEKKKQQIIDVRKGSGQEASQVAESEAELRHNKTESDPATNTEMTDQQLKEQEHVREQMAAELNELAQICSSGDDKTVCEYFQSDQFQTILQSGSIEYNVKYETPNGKLGIYNNGEYLYFGEYDGEMRSGNGAWYNIKYCAVTPYYAHGEWKNDKPNGNQSVYWAVPQYGQENTLAGTVVDGIWEGAVTNILMDNGTNVSFTINFHGGIADVVEVINGIEMNAVDSSTGRTMSRADNSKPGGIWGFSEMPL